ncbi:hypothetical protein CkaCkLH20_08526 [Colletotrichum karsti]|uniref:RNA polymerase II-associated protein 1-like protein n=1 Tax=Colletotrichum karsti TaxID=1095194 RepID=A0A9P6LFH6_9PEZI|nr:uncharacterized protein CkaCkLH20_08526 [Colletotrichum karsti]KAF9874154.1 hypothetical protein CkaCkLH20_08526 [Colletotrichum karsti]
MSSSAPRSGERVIHQDFIARIRYSNALPPPPNPPKLLDIPNTGLASGQYTTPGFASRLAREQPLNIEVDAELGMPLDLVGMPGIFDGDESSIQAPSHPPPVHPHDRPLLRPLSTLGRAKSNAEASVSFLRRTEYISSVMPRKGGAGAAGAFINPKLKRPEKRRSPEPDKDSPAAIRRKIEKSFESAERFISNPSRHRHPSKPNVSLVSSYPLLPDPDALPDSGAYVTVKLLTNPIASGNKYDRRLLSGLLRPLDRSADENEAYQAALEAHERDPARFPKPKNLMDYSFFLPATTKTGDNFRAKFDPENPDHDDDALYTNKSQGSDGFFTFHRLRAYETTKEVELDHNTKYDEELILAFNDEPSAGKQKAAYYYPVIQRTTIRPQRAKNIARTITQEEDVQAVSEVEVSICDPKGTTRENMKRYREKPIGFVEEEQEQEQEQAAEGNGEGAAPGTPSDHEQDANGDEEDDD